MCLIIAQPAKSKTVPFEHFKNAAEHNPDGMGLMYARDGRVVVKTRLTGIEDFYEQYLVAARTGGPVVVHFRWATHGSKGIANVHPFFLRDDLAFCHNGVLPFKEEDGMSDTRVFARSVLRKLPADFYLDEVLLTVLDRFIGSDKLAFLDGNGILSIVGESRGKWIGGSWYSNEYSIRGWKPEPKKSKKSKGLARLVHPRSKKTGRFVEREPNLTLFSAQEEYDASVIGLHERAYIFEGEEYCLNCLPDSASTAGLAYIDLFDGPQTAPIWCGVCGDLLNDVPGDYVWDGHDLVRPDSIIDAPTAAEIEAFTRVAGKPKK